MNNLTMQSTSDEHLMAAYIATKDDEIFSEIYRRHFKELAKYASWMIHDEAIGKDIAQNIFLRILREPSNFDPSRKFTVWLYTLVRNRCRNEWRDRKTRSRLHQVLPKTIEERSPQSTADRMALVKMAIQNLTEIHREVFVMKYSKNLSIGEISVICKCSEGTIKSRLFYAMKSLREQLQQIEIEYE